MTTVYSTQSTRWDCTCPDGWDSYLDGHDDDCPAIGGGR